MKKINESQMVFVVGAKAPSSAYCFATGAAAVGFLAFGLVGIAAGAAAGIHHDLKACWNS